MAKFEYKVIQLKVDRIWTGKAEADYLEIINHEGSLGWEFQGFVPPILHQKTFKGQELLFQRKIEED